MLAQRGPGLRWGCPSRPPHEGTHSSRRTATAVGNLLGHPPAAGGMPTEALVGIHYAEPPGPRDGQHRDEAALAVDLEIGELLPCRRQAPTVQADDGFRLAGREVDLEAKGPGDAQQGVGCIGQHAPENSQKLRDPAPT